MDKDTLDNSPPQDGDRIITVELKIGTDLYHAALIRAQTQNERLAAVVRASIIAAAASAEPVENPVVKPRPYGEDRTRLRLDMPLTVKNSAAARIEASGESVPSAVERYLRVYIESGTIVNV
jgi:hypothetical protein